MKRHTLLIRISYIAILLLVFIATVGISVLLQSKQLVYKNIEHNSEIAAVTTPFPISVDPFNQTVIEDQSVETYFSKTLAYGEIEKNTWWAQLATIFANKDWYQNLASPVGRIIVIWPGERKEEIAKNIGGVLRWNQADREEFMNLIANLDPVLSEGKFSPGQYVIHRNALPEEVAELINDQFSQDVTARYTKEIAAKVTLKEALTIASLLEREAGDFENMREVSGVIWNRLFADMPLQLDATLQYARAEASNGDTWWPTVRPVDKYLDSPYNTYLNSGLPPGPIANPSPEAVLAALNPRATDCMYYFHHTDGSYYCSVTYEEHVEKLKAFYGQGK